MSVQGRFIVFASAATNLVPGDTNRRRDIFVLDRATGVIERVSVSSGEEQAHRGSFSPAISAHGRYVTFSSSAANLVPNDTGRSHDVFMRDRVAGVTRRISVNSRGIPADTGESGCPCDISTHGRFVSFASNATNFAPRHRGSDRSNVYVRDTVAHVTERISDGLDGGAGNWPSGGASMSADGRYVAFSSNASNLVPNDPNGPRNTAPLNVFVRDRQTDITRRVSVGLTDVDSGRPDISASGRYVVFWSERFNVVPGDTNRSGDVFLRDLERRTTRRVSIGTGGLEGDRSSYTPKISPDGGFVMFGSVATNLVPDDTNGVADVFVRDLAARTTERVSVSSQGDQANLDTFIVGAISEQGTYTTFSSDASNLIPTDTNDRTDTFLHTAGP